MAQTPAYTLVEVNDDNSRKAFLDFPAQLYRGHKNYVRPLDQDIKAVFDPDRNKLFRKGGARRWLLKDANRKTVGRIAAFYNEATAKANDQPTGGVGFFDCINDKTASTLLFDACKLWLTEKGMEAMDGPINFGERDSFWGCLVDGFHEPVYNMPYNFPYYRELFEAYGFQNYFNQYTYHRTFEPGGLEEVMEEKAKRIFSNPDYRFKTIDLKQTEKFAEDFMVIFNKAWARFPGIKKLSRLHAIALLKQMQPIMDTRLVLFGYHKEEPIAFFIMMPDINQIIRHFNGKLNLVNKLRTWYLLRIKKTCTRVMGRIFGVVPEHQGKGLEGGLIKAFEKIVHTTKFHYTDLEMNWIGDFNPSMMKVCEQIGAKIRKTHITYRYLFDRNKPFKRYKKVNT
jgi:GNAT superfamily N-acetyltransferase